MKKIFAKQNILPVIVLGTICLVVAALLGGVNMIAAPIIEDAKNQKANEALLVVLPGGKDFEEIDLTDEYPAEVKKAHKADIGYVFEVNTRGKEQMTIMCGVDSDGKIVNVKVLSEQETPGYKEKVLPLVTGDEGKYNGKDSSTLAPEIFTGATLTSNGVYDAVKASLNAYAVAAGKGAAIEDEEEELVDAYKTDSEIIALGEELVEGSAGFEKIDVTVDSQNTVKLYREKSGEGFLAYTVVLSTSYPGYFESETLIYVDKSGTVKNVKKLICKISESNPEWGYIAPSAEEVDALYARLPGTTSSTVGGVELVTNATNTTERLRDVIKEALIAVYHIDENSLPRPEEDVKALASKMMGGASLTDMTPADNLKIKRLYKDEGGRGYVAYLVALSPNYGTVETETLVHIGTDGRINNVGKLVWKVSDPMPEWGYNPPSDDEVAEFYKKLIGKNSQNIGDVDLKTGATSTTERMVSGVTAALEEVDLYVGNTARIVGIVGIVVIVLSLASCMIIPKIMRRRKNG